jgi:hypothetical protein
VRKGDTILSEEQRQELTQLGFAWNITEINASKNQQIVLEVCLIVYLSSLSHNFSNIQHLIQANKSECIKKAAELWTSVAQEGNKIIRQTKPFKEAVISCLTEGHSQQAIAKAIHKKAINDGHYSGECVGQGENYIKIKTSVSNCNQSRLKGGEKNDKVEEDDTEDLDSAPNDEKLKDNDCDEL